MTRPAAVDGRDPTRVVTRRWVALLGMHVVRPDGNPAGARRSLVRVAAWIVDGIALLLPIARWSAWFTPGHRRVGDWLAGTYVVGHPAGPVRDTTESG